MVLGIVGVLASLAIAQYRTNLVKAGVAEAFSLFAGTRSFIEEYYALHGYWPDTKEVPAAFEKQNGRKVARIAVADGAVSALFQEGESLRLGGAVLTFRPTVGIQEDSASVIWLCGHASPPAGYRVQGNDLTDLPDTHLISLCRSRRTPLAENLE